MHVSLLHFELYHPRHVQAVSLLTLTQYYHCMCLQFNKISINSFYAREIDLFVLFKPKITETVSIYHP